MLRRLASLRRRNLGLVISLLKVRAGCHPISDPRCHISVRRTDDQRQVARDEEIYREHADELVRFAMGLVGRSDAQDVVSAAVLRSMTSRNWSHVVNTRAYLYRAVLNEARNEHRDRHRRWRKALRSGTTELGHMPEYRPEILAAVMKLSVQQRASIVLRYWEDLHVSEIARRLAISEGSVHRHLARARSKLRGALDA